MNQQTTPSPKIPLKEALGTIPGFFGIRLEEEPKYEVVERLPDVEIRKYTQILIAQVAVPGNHDEAVDEGFRILANYIFEGNTAHEHISMTTPVLQKPAENGETWLISFVLPSQFTMQSVPRPEHPGIALMVVPEHTVAVLRYSGNNGEKKREDARTRLEAALRNSEYRVNGGITWAQYDQPFTIPFLKRNEAQYVVEKKNAEEVIH